ncbi:MAG TPA: hypothetical protein VEW68_03125 [Patescibacteria group bacterium]|nr:hypothetical protein [Patescibacteria group bacterium]
MDAGRRYFCDLMRGFFAVLGLAAATLAVGASATAALADSAPTVGPVQAECVPSEFATHYRIVAADPNGRSLTYQWTLAAPAADPNCNHFSQQPDDSAIWHHGDQDGCNHNVQVPQGHPGTVTVVVSDGLYRCVATYFGTESGQGSPAACTAVSTATSTPATSPTSVPTSTPAATNALSTGLPAWLWGVGVVALAGAALIAWLSFGRRDPCAELRDRCRELQAAAAAAAQKAAAARSAADAAKKACDDARKARQSAEQKVKAAAEGGGSWIEGSEHPGERLTSHDLALQAQFEADVRAQVESGQLTAAQGQEALSHWDDPQQWDRLRKQERDKAGSDLAAAKAAEDKACAEADRMASEASAADSAAAAAAKAADAACAAADECEKNRREQAAAANPPTPAVAPPTPTTVSPPPTPTPPTVSPPSTPPPSKSKPKDECADSDPPRTEVRCETEVDMFRMSELTLEIGGVYAMGQEAVDQAMAGLTDAMWVIDIGTLAVGAIDNAPLAAGTWIAGKAGFPSFDNITSLPTDAALDGLRKLIEKMRDLRQTGDWTLKCNRYHLKARCEVTWSCVGGRWTVTDRKMVVEQVGGPTPVSSPPEFVKPPEGVNRAMTKMANAFRGPNRTAQAKLDACARACAR